MIKGMGRNYKVLWMVHYSIQSSIAENFQAYLFSPDFSEQEEIENDIGTNSSRIFNISENLGANSPLNSFDLFYYINGRFPFTAGHLYVPDEVKPDVNVKKLKIKEIYKTFRGSNSPSKWPSLPLFLCALNLFLGGKEKISKAARTKLYLNLTLSVLSSYDYLKLQALTDLYTEMNHQLKNSIFANNSRKKEEETKKKEKVAHMIFLKLKQPDLRPKQMVSMMNMKIFLLRQKRTGMKSLCQKLQVKERKL